MRFCPVYHSSSTWSPKSIHKTDGSESESHSIVSDSLLSRGLYSPWNSPGQNTGVGSHSLLQGIFPNQGSNPDLPHCRWIFYQLSHEGVPRILEWVPSPADLPNSGIKPGSLGFLADSLAAELSGKPIYAHYRV